MPALRPAPAVTLTTGASLTAFACFFALFAAFSASFPAYTPSTELKFCCYIELTSRNTTLQAMLQSMFVVPSACISFARHQRVTFWSARSSNKAWRRASTSSWVPLMGSMLSHLPPTWSSTAAGTCAGQAL